MKRLKKTILNLGLEDLRNLNLTYQKDVIEKIGEKGVKEATGKGKDTFLKKSNPEHPGRHIDLKDAVD